ncbi:hypothetical protein AB7B51_17420 [Acinetobacter baumannii]|uniref:hypothetical protein n=1 Tax=Acinetobacter baumannii TaxID=470 RepID=UPI0034E29F91
MALAITIGCIMLICSAVLRFINDDSPIWALAGLAGIILVFGSAFFGAIIGPENAPLTEAQKWEIFKKEHNCKIVQKRDGYSTGGVGVTMSGHVGVIVGDDVPDQAAYLCDDGVTYWKNI